MKDLEAEISFERVSHEFISYYLFPGILRDGTIDVPSNYELYGMGGWMEKYHQQTTISTLSDFFLHFLRMKMIELWIMHKTFQELPRMS